MNRKVRFRIHTDAIKENLTPKAIAQKKICFVYAGEADLLNIALFGRTAKEGRGENLDLRGNIRDHATLEQLVVFSHLESISAEFTKLNKPQEERLQKLNKIAIGLPNKGTKCDIGLGSDRFTRAIAVGSPREFTQAEKEKQEIGESPTIG